MPRTRPPHPQKLREKIIERAPNGRCVETTRSRRSWRTRSERGINHESLLYVWACQYMYGLVGISSRDPRSVFRFPAGGNVREEDAHHC